MIDITIYIEGVPSTNQVAGTPEVLTMGNAASFRESFYKLFSQQLSPKKFNLMIQTFGSVTLTDKMLNHIEKKGINAVVVIDLDAPKSKKDERLQRYEVQHQDQIFFMIQEMEAWILSQVDKIEQFGANEGLIRKKRDEDIASNPLIKNRHPEEISKPSEKLDTIFRQYFDKLDRQGRAKAIRYSKAKDGPKLIGLLELDVLMLHFDEVKRLVDYIQG
jgi:hypothetical protein